MVDGIRLNGIEGDGAIQQYFNEGMFSEMSYQTGGISAETSGGGVRLNMIPKDGGNAIKGDVFFSATGVQLQADPLDAGADQPGSSGGQRAREHSRPEHLGRRTDQGQQVWFFGSTRHWGVNQTLGELVLSARRRSRRTMWPSAPTCRNQAVDNNLIKSFMARAHVAGEPEEQVQLLPRPLIKFRGHEQNSVAGRQLDLVRRHVQHAPAEAVYYMTEAKWTSVITTRLLFEAGLGINNESVHDGRDAARARSLPRRDDVQSDPQGEHHQRPDLGRAGHAVLRAPAGSGDRHGRRSRT